MRLGVTLNRGGDEKLEIVSSTAFTEIDVRTFNGTTVPVSTNSTVAEHHGLPPPVTQSGIVPTIELCNRKKVGGFSFYWARFKKRIGTGTAPSSSSLVGESAAEGAYTRRVAEHYEEGNNDGIVDEIVVDRTWTEEIQTSVSSDCVPTLEKTPSQHIQSSVESASIVYEGFWSFWKPLAIIRWRTWPFFMEVFSSRFADEKNERHYAQESWFLKKSLALWASLWLICNWVLGCIFVHSGKVFLIDKIFYFAVAPLLSIPVVFMVMYDWPRDRPYLYQIFLLLSVWCWSFYVVMFILFCGFYSPTPNCGGRDFVQLFYYNSALQTIALFGLKLNRFPAAIGALSFFLFTSISIIPLKGSWGRPMINFFVFQAFLIYLHYMRESSERRLYTLRDQLKIQYKATQKAQINERKAAESKRRLTSYVFHVRVPLNTALLAVQNMEASGMVGKGQEIEFSALCGSLSMMSKVLNDVLDFNRMDSGKFESASRPYAFRQVMRSLFVPLRMATDARGLNLETNLDPNIDIIARKVRYETLGEDKDAVRNHIREYPDVDGVVLGDETRLRQIITNLTSNACKFTPSGGNLSISTRLILPDVPEGMDPLDIETAKIPRIEKPEIHPNGERDVEKLSHHTSSHSRSGDSFHDENGAADAFWDEKRDRKPLSTELLMEHNQQHATSPLEYIVVRIEVTDTGFGIKPQDMAESKLFSAFNQTEQGRQQGGKGTGLGLALVRQIVRLSGGRLGVRSKTGEGSTFWVELPLGVGIKTVHSQHGNSETSDSDPMQPNRRLRKESTVSTIDHKNGVPIVMSGGVRRSRGFDTAMQGIMEQGGLFEIKLGIPFDGTTSRALPKLVIEPVEQNTLESPQTQVASTSTQCSLPPNAANIEEVEQGTGLKESVGEHDDDRHESLNPGAMLHPRPRYVKLPSPKVFVIEEGQPPLTDMTINTSLSDRSSLNLKKFDDSFVRGTPSTSFTALDIEPGLPVLVVDDDPITRTLMKRILTRLGCRVTCAENGGVALEILLSQRLRSSLATSAEGCAPGTATESELLQSSFHDEGKFAVVFLDNQMPVMTGLEVVEKLREMHRKDFVVGVTGNALLTDQEEYYAAGVDRVLTKPVMERYLRDILVEADERRKALLCTEPPPES